MKGLEYHSSLCIFRRNTRLAITKVPASCHSLSNLTRRSIRTSVEEDVGKSLFRKCSEVTWLISILKGENSPRFASSSLKLRWDSKAMQLSSSSSFLTVVPDDQEENRSLLAVCFIRCSILSKVYDKKGIILITVLHIWLHRRWEFTKRRKLDALTLAKV